jgi:hypothetical protein
MKNQIKKRQIEVATKGKDGLLSQVRRIKATRRFAVVCEPYPSGGWYGAFHLTRNGAKRALIEALGYPHWAAARSAGFSVRLFRVECIG